MEGYVKCKACGYIMKASKVGKLCPACGVPAERFEPYVRRVSEKRQKILDIHLHPIILHFPQAFATILVPLAAALAILGESPLRSILLDSTRFLAALLPLSVAAAFAAGVVDGQLRFRKVTTPLLIRKMITGALFFALSLAAAALALFTPLDSTSLGAFAVLAVLALAAGTLLGVWGSTLMDAAFPG